eukprot:2845783-Prymnesium_polylepis.3
MRWGTEVELEERLFFSCFVYVFNTLIEPFMLQLGSGYSCSAPSGQAAGRQRHVSPAPWSVGVLCVCTVQCLCAVCACSPAGEALCAAQPLCRDISPLIHAPPLLFTPARHTPKLYS